MEINPLNILKKRKLSYFPVHFVKAKIFDQGFIENSVVDWVDSKLTGRYAILNFPSLSEGKISLATYIAFEEQKELTYFMLACPFLRR